MKTLCLLCLACGLAEQPPSEPAESVLVLANEGVLVGRVDRVPAGYRLRSERGESIFPTEKVLRVCGSRREAYFYLQGRANLRDPHERLRLARWCSNQGLLLEAKLEAEAAVALKAGHPEANALLRQLQRQLDEAGKANTLPSPAVDSSLPAASPPLRTPAEASGNPLEGWEKALTKPALKEFTHRIQPILLNSCGTGGCHGGERPAGGFHLQVPPSAHSQTPTLTRHNLGQALRLVNKADFGNSLLLKKGLEAHGGTSRLPLGGAETPTYRAVEAWLRLIAPPSPVVAKAVSPLEVEPSANATPAGSTPFAGDRPDATEEEAAPPTPAPGVEEPSTAAALEQLLKRRANPAADGPGAGIQKQSGTLAPPTPNGEELQKLVDAPSEALLGSGAPPMIAGGKVVGQPAQPPPTRKATAQPAVKPGPVPTGSSQDPYDPRPFNEANHPRRKAD